MIIYFRGMSDTCRDVAASSLLAPSLRNLSLYFLRKSLFENFFLLHRAFAIIFLIFAPSFDKSSGDGHIEKTLNWRLFAAIGISQILNYVVITQWSSSIILVYCSESHTKKRGLMHCLSYIVGQCESLDSGISKS